MTILVDMDDTIVQLLQAWLLKLNEYYDLDIAYEDIRSWDIEEAFPELTWEQIEKNLMLPGFWKSINPVPGAQESLKRLMEAGHDVFIVTATLHDNIPEKMNELLFKHFPFLSWSQVIVADRKQMIRGDVLIDDGVHNLEGGEYAKILMSAPYNEDYDAEANGMIRVRDWNEIEAVISKMAGGQA